MPFSDFSQEIIDLIVDELRTGFDLCQSSYVSPAFLASCRRRLFAHIKLASADQCERLHTVISSHSHIVLIIRKLYIVDQGWAHEDPYFASIIQLLTGCGMLETLRFEVRPLANGWSPKDWFMCLNSSLMGDLFKSPQLNSITLDDVPLCAFPTSIELLTTTPSLQHFAFNGTCRTHLCDMSSRYYHSPPSSHPPEAFLKSLDRRDKTSEKSNRIQYKEDPSSFPSPPHLHSLDARGEHWDHLIDHLWPSLSKLRTLQISTKKDFRARAPPLFWELLEFCSETLVSLRWDESRWVSWAEEPKFHLPQNLRLIILSESYYDRFILLNFLSTNYLPRSIEYFFLVYAHWQPHPGKEDSRDLDRKLAEMFARADMYTSLKGVYLTFVRYPMNFVSGEVDNPFDETRMVNPLEALKAPQWMEDCFPLFHKTGLLRCLRGSREQVEAAFKVLNTSLQR